MLTIGIDLAAQPQGTAACTIEWSGAEATVTNLTPGGVDDQDLLRLLQEADKVGIDVPLGWPDGFFAAMAAHRDRSPWPESPTTGLRFRLTDLYVQQQTGQWPLSVSSDRIGVTAFRAARILSLLPERVDRLGGGTVVEVYPAAALRRWGFVAKGYKTSDDKGIAAREGLVAAFHDRTAPWLHLDSAQWELGVRSHDAFDSVVAALVARASAVGLCDASPGENGDVAAREGWIALPGLGSLDRLV